MSVAAELARIVNAGAHKPNGKAALPLRSILKPEHTGITPHTMSPIALGIAASVLVIGLLAFYGISQAMAARYEQKRLMANALFSRADHFQELLSGLPPAFLPADLRQLVSNSLSETWRQLRALDPHNSKFKQAQQNCQALLNQAQSAMSDKRVPLDNPAVIKEARAHLKDLAQFLQQQLDTGHLSAQQAQHFNRELHQLQIQLSLDSYNLTIKQAHAAQQFSVAAHNCDMAKKTLLRENNPKHQALIAHYQQLADKFLEQATAQANNKRDDSNASPDKSSVAPSSAAAPDHADTPDPAAKKQKRPDAGLKKNIYD